MFCIKKMATASLPPARSLSGSDLGNDNQFSALQFIGYTCITFNLSSQLVFIDCFQLIDIHGR